MRRAQTLFCVTVVAFVLSALVGRAWAADVAVLSSSSFVDDVGCHIVGEVQNTYASSVNVEMIANLYNETGTKVGTSFGYTILDVVPPGAKASFDLLFSEAAIIQQIESYSLIVSYQFRSSEKPGGLKILGNSSHINQFGDLHVVGEIQNVGTQGATKVEAIATFYASDGTVIDCSFDLTDLSVLMPNQKAPFDILVRNSSRIPQMQSYQLTCQSQEYGDVVPEYTSIVAALLLTFSTILTAAFWKKKTRTESSQTTSSQDNHTRLAFPACAP
jgi:hypothetical protein